MLLNHINLVVNDVAATSALFQGCFDFRCTDIKGDHAIVTLEGADGFTIVLMNDKNGPVAYPGAFHIGFILEDKKRVERAYDALQQGGIDAGHAPSNIRSSYGFYFHFDALMIEVSTYNLAD